MAFVQCYVVDICTSVYLFGVALWLCGKCCCGTIREKVGSRARCGGRVVCITRKIL